MAKTKKFGTFSGVFTPSILTILGVIMYLRFPAIIGQAGLINTIGIIVIAHIISITTSLSVASLSTDKPVQTGGTYFMISRSLGLPIGGTLGLALFVGLSFSVSLYLIGFAESFLQYWGMDLSINTIRLTGTIVLIAVTTITFISTSLAIKSQYFIMAAIGLSLLSIFFGKHEFAPQEIHLSPLAGAAPFMILFGIFFPAVTGFEAGVSMSGDLKDARKSLPLGAILAVAIGFVVYLGLALFYSLTVDANALVNDPQILFKIALVPALVIAGIWGATLSSALGSILGAPRILQAIAMDKIVPKIFAKGTGKTNEPRNALLLAFVIAEAGILIGQLDVIARIVSMFFITTYGFLNLASAIESWSSSDFRPAFKIPRFVSILGAISAFIVMILLDFLALAGATVVLGVLYFYLQRKELLLESGDAWSSFWTNLAKRSLLKLSIRKVDKRNWRPNIILFSGGENARPHLVEMGLSLTGKLGALTDFDLSPDADHSRQIQNAKEKKKRENKGYFIRQLASESLKDAIKTITNVYGFSGFEPNTVLMGWSKSIENISFLTEILRNNKTKNLSTIFLDYDKNAGFGQYQQIDIWWNGKGRLLNFALNLIKFLHSDPSWRDAVVRILVINSESTVHDSIYRNVTTLLNENRIKAEIQVFNDDFGTRKKEEIIQVESKDADLIMLGLSPNEKAFKTEYIQSVNKLTELPVSLLLLYPSNEFEDVDFIEDSLLKEKAKYNTYDKIELPTLPEITSSLVKTRVQEIEEKSLNCCEEFCDISLEKIVNQMIHLLSPVKELINDNFQLLKDELETAEHKDFIKTVSRNHQAFLRYITSNIETKNKELLEETGVFLEKGISKFKIRIDNIIYESPEIVQLSFIIPNKSKEKKKDFELRKYLRYLTDRIIYPEIKNQIESFTELSSSILFEMKDLILEINDIYDKLLITDEKEYTDILNDFLHIENQFNVLEKNCNNFKNNAHDLLFKSFRQVSIELIENMATIRRVTSLHKRIKRNKITPDKINDFYTDAWIEGILLLNNSLYLDLLILTNKNLVGNIIKSGFEKINNTLVDDFFSPVNSLMSNIENIEKFKNQPTLPIRFNEELQMQQYLKEPYDKVLNIIEDFPEEINVPLLVSGYSEKMKTGNFESIAVNLYKLSYFYLESLFYEPVYRNLEQFEKEVQTSVTECKEVNSLLQFYIHNIEKQDSVSVNNIQPDNVFFKRLKDQANAEVEKVKSALTQLEHNSNIYLQEAFSKLFYHSIIEANKALNTEQREQSGQKFNLWLNDKINKIKLGSNNALIYLIDNLSIGILFKNKYLAEVTEYKTQNRQILDLVEKVIPDNSIYNNVPVFYRNLMSSISKITDELWVERPKEIKIIKDALQRHKKGIGGAVLIRGVHGAGKTAISRYVVGHMFKKQNVFWISAPSQGSINPDDLLLELKKQYVGYSDFSGIINNLPPDSIVVINDLELWFERCAGGGVVIMKIIELIREFGNKVFFLINCNTHAFNIINNLYNLEDNCLAIVDCEPFNSKELKKLILCRHKSSSISLTYNGMAEESISNLKWSYLFNSYFNASDGIPGVALNTWKANIIKGNSNSITIKKPIKPETDILKNLHNDWLIAITMFIQHKNITVDKIIRLTNYSESDVRNLLANLKNAGLIVNKTNDVFTLGRNIEPFLVKLCLEKGLI